MLRVSCVLAVHSIALAGMLSSCGERKVTGTPVGHSLCGLYHLPEPAHRPDLGDTGEVEDPGALLMLAMLWKC